MKNIYGFHGPFLIQDRKSMVPYLKSRLYFLVGEILHGEDYILFHYGVSSRYHEIPLRMRTSVRCTHMQSDVFIFRTLKKTLISAEIGLKLLLA